MNALDRAIQPATPWGEIIMTPPAIPVGLVAGIADAAVVYPATQAPPCARQIHDRYFRNAEEPTWKKSLLFVPRHFIAVPDFLFLWSVHSWIDVKKPADASSATTDPEGSPEPSQ